MPQGRAPRTRHRPGWLLARWPQLAVLAALAVLPTDRVVAAPGDLVAGAPVTARDLDGRQRVAATPGDLKLANAEATAVVRRQDGWLVDFWRNRLILPTSKQLGDTTHIDGLWRLYSVVTVGKRQFAILTEQVTPLPDGIRVEGRAQVGRSRYRAITTYRLDPVAPRLHIVTELSTTDGRASPGPLGVGDSVKWGNQQYFVSGLQVPRMKYRGPAQWIGRRGAGGDLLLRTLESQPMLLDYTTRRRGFAGTIATVYQRAVIPVGRTLRVSRELSFEPLPVAPEAAVATLGTLRISVVDERGRPLPAKVRIDRAGRKEPLFDDDGDLYGADRFMWTGNGELDRELAPGRYQLLITGGPERDAHRARVEIRASQTEQVQARLPRVITTPGWISADLHLHQSPSIDAGISLAHRVVSVAAEGVELAVTADHFVVTDLAPTVRRLREQGVLSVALSTMAGSEVSTVGHRFGHFNVFPLRTDQNVRYVDTTPSELFADARRQSPSGVLQVNHPRFDPAIGYFRYYGIDENTGRPLRAGYDPGYDTIEVYNGDDARDVSLVRKVLADYMRLLGTGRRYAATGSSDSHKLAFLDPGLPRTLINYGTASSDEQDVEAQHDAVLQALKQGRAIVTSGPFIEASIAGRGPGETARGVGQRVKIRVVVRAAPWVDVTQVEILEGPGARQVHWTGVPRTAGVLRLDREFEVTVSKGTFFVVVAQGARGLPNTALDYVVPLAFTNAIWVEP